MLTILSQLNCNVRSSRTWTPELCHAIVADQTGFMNFLGRWGRGVWTQSAEDFCQNALWTNLYGDIKFSDVVRVMSQVAMKRDGYTHLQTSFDAFAFCHKQGFLHTEPSAGPDKRKLTYVFASPIHRRYTVTIRKMMVMLNVALELRTCASYQVPTQTQHQMAARSCRYA